MFLYFIVLFLFVFKIRAWDQIDWALKNGAYLNPHLTYRNEGMYANDIIEKGDILAKIPESLEFKCIECTRDKCDYCSMFELSKKLETDKSPFWSDYIHYLGEKCRVPFCDPNQTNLLTFWGKEMHKNVFGTNNMANLTWSVISRGWTTGMRPLLELFNHNKSASTPYLEKGEYVIRAASEIQKGEQAYDNYGMKSVLDLYFSYGFVDDTELTCNDMLALRVGNPQERLRCLNEFLDSISTDDFAAVKGVAQYFDQQVVLPEEVGK